MLAECIARDNERPPGAGATVLELGRPDRHLAAARARPARPRPGKGWAHAIAHGADALGAAGRRRRTSAAPELTVLLDVIADRVLLPVDRLFTSGEPDRLARATMAVLRRNLVPLRVLEPWIARLAAARRRTPAVATTTATRSSSRGNAEALPAGAATCSSRSAPRPPEVRSDLLLVLVDALRATNPHFLRPR